MLVGGLFAAFLVFGIGGNILAISNELDWNHILRLLAAMIGSSFLGALAGAWVATVAERDKRLRSKKPPEPPVQQDITLPINV